MKTSNKRRRITPLAAARALRIGLEDQIAKTWADHDVQYEEAVKYPNGWGKFTNSWRFGQLIKEQADCTFREASRAMEKAVPELFADYWAALPYPDAQPMIGGGT